MLTNSKSLVILTLFAVLWLENKAHRCGSRHEKTHKKFGKETTKSKASTSTPASTSTTATPIKVSRKCNTGTVPTCECDKNFDSLYYPVPKSGKCKDVFKRLPTTPDYHFLEENCHKAQRTVCRVDSNCESFNLSDNQQPETPSPPPFRTPDVFIFRQNVSAPFCLCDVSSFSMPKSGNCTEYGLHCNKAHALCWDTCTCNEFYVDPTECDPQKCNNAHEPFCVCDIDGGHYPVPESGNCMDYLSNISTTPTYFYRFGSPCYKARNVCKCVVLVGEEKAQCTCNDECVSGCP